MQRRLSDWLSDRYRRGIKRSIDSTLPDDVITKYGEMRAGLSGDDFGTLIIQLKALGLIVKSERARSVKDKGTYWTLTPDR